MRFYLGMLCLSGSVILPLGALAVPLLGLSGPKTAAVMGALTVGAPEVCMVLAAMLLGKENLQLILRKAWGLVRRTWEPHPVPAWRYYLGLGMVVGSALPSWLLAYFPDLVGPRVTVLAVADLAFVAGFFVAGGELWEKLRRLATWEGSV